MTCSWPDFKTLLPCGAPAVWVCNCEDVVCDLHAQPASLVKGKPERGQHWSLRRIA